MGDIWRRRRRHPLPDAGVYIFLRADGDRMFTEGETIGLKVVCDHPPSAVLGSFSQVLIIGIGIITWTQQPAAYGERGRAPSFVCVCVINGPTDVKKKKQKTRLSPLFNLSFFSTSGDL